MYSFSVLCWEMLTGEVPWRQLAGPMQVIYQVGVLKEVRGMAGVKASEGLGC